MISVITSVTLEDYSNSAKNKPVKFNRCLESMISQGSDFEFIIVCDGDENAYIQASAKLKNNCQYKLILLDKQPRWSGNCRNTGIKYATGHWIIYLDADDYYLNGYLKSLQHEINQHPENDWFIVPHYEYDLTGKNIIKKYPNINKNGSSGTANIIHRKSMSCRWPVRANYSIDDWMFIQNMKKESQRFRLLNSAGYVIGHIPFKYDY